MSDSGDSPVCVLGFDVGARRIGVAVGNTLSRTARAIAMVAARDDGPDWNAVAALVREWRPDRLVVGEPLTLTAKPNPPRTWHAASHTKRKPASACRWT